MCQVLFSTKTNPPMDTLVYANTRNDHGFGYAWCEGKSVFWSKGFESKVEDDVARGLSEFLNKPFPKAIHFRLATHGGIRKELTHPFPIKRGNSLALTGEAKAVLFHNGIWNKWEDMLRHAIFGGTLNPNILREAMSDSRAMAILCQRYGPDILDVMPLQTNKVLVMAAETWYKYGDWKQMDGWCASNFAIEPPTVLTGTKTDRREYKGSHGIYTVPAAESGGSQRYLSADREEVEHSILSWGARGHE